MEESFDIIGTTKDELKIAISLFYTMVCKHNREECNGITGYLYDKDNDSLTLYSSLSHNKEVNVFPMPLSENTLLEFLWDFGKKYIPKDFGGDGSVGKGWNLRYNYSSPYSSDSCRFRFVTMYYGK